MAKTELVAKPREDTIPASYGVLAQSFRIHLRAENKSPRTIETYLVAVDLLGRFLVERGMPVEPDAISREHVEEFLIDLQSRSKPGTVSTRFRALQQFFKWLQDEGEISRSPVERMKRPIVPEEPVSVLTEEQIRRLLRTCEGTDFDARRDTAIIRLFLDTGMRRTELASLSVSDVDFEMSAAMVLGKGRRPRACPFAAKTARALNRYLRVRQRHTHGNSEALWLGRNGPLTSNGVFQIVKERGRQAGIEIHPHMFRHTYAHMFRAAGGGEDDLMVLGGWRSRSMLNRYGASAAAERAMAAHARYAPGEKF